MNNSATTRWLSNRWWIDVLAWSAFLWIAAGLMYRAPLQSDDWNAGPLWRHVLIGQAFPWVLQFVAVSIPVLCFARWRLRWDMSQLLIGVLIPLIWGIAWWGAYAVAIPYSVTLDMITDQLVRGVEARFAGPEWSDGLLLLTGTCVNPLQLKPPTGALVGVGYWDFVLHGLSSLLNIVYWIAVARWIPIRQSGGITRSEFGRLLVAVLVWSSPMAMRAAPGV
jgi:hypothetical protein